MDRLLKIKITKNRGEILFTIKDIAAAWEKL